MTQMPVPELVGDQEALSNQRLVVGHLDRVADEHPLVREAAADDTQSFGLGERGDIDLQPVQAVLRDQHLGRSLGELVLRLLADAAKPIGIADALATRTRVVDRQTARIVGVLMLTAATTFDSVAAVDADKLARLVVVGVLLDERLRRAALRAVDLEPRARRHPRAALLADADRHL